MSTQFVIDKRLNEPIEKWVAPEMIHQWYGLHGKRILGISRNGATENSEEQRWYDLIDTTGTTWEVKTDKKFTTGNVFIEHTALEHSKADYYLILAFHGYVLPTSTLREIVASKKFKEVFGGEDKKMRWTLLPINELSKIADVV